MSEPAKDVADVKEPPGAKSRVAILLGNLVNGLRSVFVDAYGLAGLPVLCATVFASVTSGALHSLPWWVPWVWYLVLTVIVFTMSRAAIIVKVLLSLVATAYAVTILAQVSLLASPNTEAYISAALAPVLGLCIYWVASQFGSYGMSRWSPVIPVLGVSTLVSLFTIGFTLSPVIGAVVFLVVYLGVGLLWYRYGVKLFYRKSKMPSFTTPTRIKDVVAHDASVNNPDEDKPLWKYISYPPARESDPFSVLVVGDRAYMFFFVQMTSVFELTEKTRALSGKVKSSRLTYRDSAVEPWLFDKVISRTPAGATPILVDMRGENPKDKRNITLALPDSPLDSSGSPVYYTEVGIIYGRDVDSKKANAPLVERAEKIYGSKPALDAKAKAKLAKFRY